MKKYLSLTILFIIVFSFKVSSQTNSIVVSPTPPMGWNSYNCFGATVRENEVKANADFVALNLKKSGWQYIVVDYCWYYPHPPESSQPNPPQFRLPEDGSLVPWLPMDEYGRLLPDQGKFPGSTKENGFKPLADYIHSLGLKFGIHVMRGIPRQAVWAKSPIKNTNGIDASMIADTTSVCKWLNSMYGLDMSKKGSQEYLNSLLELYAQWGVDYIKVDDISSPYYQKEVEGYRKAIDICGRPIVFSTSPGATPISEAVHVMANANQWRLSDDFWDNWKQLKSIFELADKWTPYRGENHWPDLDMMLLGRLSRRGPVGEERETRFSKDEQFTHVTLWIISRSPLMLGCDLTVVDPFTLSLITNEEVIAVNQNSKGNKQIRDENGIIIWSADLPGTGDKYVAIFNTTDLSVTDACIYWKEIGKKGKQMVRDLWSRNDLGIFSEKYSTQIPSHGAILIKISAVSK